MLSRCAVLLAAVAVLTAMTACNIPLGSPGQATAPPINGPAVTSSSTEAVTSPAQPPEAAQPTEPLPPDSAQPTADPNAVQVSYAGISFSYDYSLASSWEVEVVPPPTPDPNVPQEWLMASHYAFTLRGYPVTHVFQPQILVFQTQAYSELNPLAAQRIAALRQLLAERPTTFPQEMPFLPVVNAAQIMHVQHAYLDFQNGSGIRYLTQHDQAYLPINNEELLYTFQGLTSDGSHLIVVTMPITHPSLPDDHTQVPGGDLTAFANNFESYLAEVVAQLDSAAPDSFAPSILVLDAMVQSLLVNPQ